MEYLILNSRIFRMLISVKNGRLMGRAGGTFAPLHLNYFENTCHLLCFSHDCICFRWKRNFCPSWKNTLPLPLPRRKLKWGPYSEGTRFFKFLRKVTFLNVRPILLTISVLCRVINQWKKQPKIFFSFSRGGGQVPPLALMCGRPWYDCVRHPFVEFEPC